MSKAPQFDYYTIQGVLGEGGMGIVYKAHDRRTDLPVAIKVMSKRLHEPELQQRFLKENQILSSLNHRNIVRCYEVTQSRDGIPSLVMEYLHGVDFRAFEGRPYSELLPLMIQVCMGLSYLKKRSILHRDLSSNNILVVLENQKRLVKILDFGVAKILHEKGTTTDGEVLTQTGQFLGKFSFASPELFRTGAVDWRSDVFSLGVIFYRALTKQPPIKVERSGNYYQWVVAHQQPYALDFPLPTDAPPLPETLKEVVRRMLAKDPDERPQTYEEIIDHLDSLQVELTQSGLEPDPSTITGLPMPVLDALLGDYATPGRPRSGPHVTPSAPPVPLTPGRAAVDEARALGEARDLDPVGAMSLDAEPAGNGPLKRTQRLDEVVDRLRRQGSLPDGVLPPPAGKGRPEGQTPNTPNTPGKRGKSQRKVASATESSVVVYGYPSGPPVESSGDQRRPFVDRTGSVPIAQESRARDVLIVVVVLLVLATALGLLWLWLRSSLYGQAGTTPRSHAHVGSLEAGNHATWTRSTG